MNYCCNKNKLQTLQSSGAEEDMVAERVKGVN